MILKSDENISLHQTCVEEAEELFNLIDKNRTYLAPWLSWVESTLSPKDTANFLSFVDKQFAIEKQIVFLLRYNGKLCGTLGFHCIKKEENYSEIGYWIDESHQGKGVVSKSVTTGMSYLREKWGIKHFVIECNEKNLSSQNVALRLGFKEIENDRYNDSNTKIYKKTFE